MSIWNIDSIIFISFLVFNIIVGLYAARGVKTIKEYAIGDGQFSSMVIAATLVATWISGSNFTSTISETYQHGLYFMWAALGDVLLFMLMAWFFAPRLEEFLGKLSIADAMGSLYGNKVRIVTAIIACIGAGGIIAGQLRVAGMLMEYGFNIPSFYGVIAAAVIVGIYSALGGVKSVTFTDVLQLFTFGTVIPTLAFFIFKSIGNPDILIDTIKTNELFNYKEVFDFTRPKSFEYLLLFIYFALPGFTPAIFQRISMSANTLQIRKSFNIAGIGCLLITVLFLFVALFLLADNPSINPNDTMKYVLLNYSYMGLKGLVLAGVMAMVMSTADSFINSTAVLVIHDIFKPLKANFVSNQLLSAKIASLFIAMLGLFIAIVGNKSIMQLIISTQSIYIPMVSVSFVAATLGFRSSSKSVLISMFFGLSSVIILKFIYHVDPIHTVFIAIFNSTTALFASHYLLKQPGGWVGIKKTGPLTTVRQNRKRNIEMFFKNVSNFSLIGFLKKSTARKDYTYVALSLFGMIATYAAIFTLPSDISLKYSKIIDVIYPSMLFTITALLSQPLWPRFIKESNAIVLVWNLVIFYVIICCCFLFVLISNFASIQLTVFMLNMMLVSMLLRWQLALIMIIGGITLTTKCLKLYLGIDILDMNLSSMQFKVGYLLLLMSASLVIFSKPKQDYYDLTETRTQDLEEQIEGLDDELSRALAMKLEFIKNLNHEIRTPITGITSFSSALYDVYKTLSPEQLDSYLKAVATSSERLISLMDNILDLSKLACENYKLDLQPVNLSEIVYEVLEKTKKLYITDQDLEFITNVERNIIADCDLHYIRSTIYNLLINAIKFSKNGKIIISLHKKEHKIKFSVQDEGIGIPKMELHTIFKPFVESSRTHSKAGGRGVGLALCKKTIELHRGKIWAESNGNKGAIFYFTLKS